MHGFFWNPSAFRAHPLRTQARSFHLGPSISKACASKRTGPWHSPRTDTVQSPHRHRTVPVGKKHSPRAFNYYNLKVTPRPLLLTCSMHGDCSYFQRGLCGVCTVTVRRLYGDCSVSSCCLGYKAINTPGLWNRGAVTNRHCMHTPAPNRVQKQRSAPHDRTPFAFL